MSKKKLKIVLERRRREGRTDYVTRMHLLKSNKHRLVIRKTTNYIIAQIIETKNLQDFTRAFFNSSELKKFGLKSGLKSTMAAYLTGYALGKKALKENIKEAILDIGLQTSTKGSRIYALVKGVIDSGLEIPCDKKMLPKQERLEGKNLKSDPIKLFDEIKSKLK